MGKRKRKTKLQKPASLAEHLRSNQLWKKPVAKDGSCLFRAVAEQARFVVVVFSSFSPLVSRINWKMYVVPLCRWDSAKSRILKYATGARTT